MRHIPEPVMILRIYQGWLTELSVINGAYINREHIETTLEEEIERWAIESWNIWEECDIIEEDSEDYIIED